MIVKISASILGIDWSEQTVVNQAVMRVATANYIHFDVADGKFVKENSFDHKLVKETSLNGTALEKDVHLMVKGPEKHVDKYIKAGAAMISFHIEAAPNPKKLLEKIKKKGVLAGIAISPATSVKKVEKFLDDADYVLVMAVKPGKGGQTLLPSAIKKVVALRKKKPDLLIEVDGGVNDDNAGQLIKAGANILVSGSFIFKSYDPKHAIDLLRNA